MKKLMQNMKDPHKQRKDFLTALINYGNDSGNFNPHFYKKEMMDILKISARTRMENARTRDALKILS